MKNIVLNIPHASTVGIFGLGGWPRNSHFTNNVMRRVTDWYADLIFHSNDPAIHEVIFPYSRLVCDVTGDDEESIIWPSQGGYNRNDLSDAQHAALLDLYNKHNEQVKQHIDEESILIECHTFTSYEIDHDIVLGTVDWVRNGDIVEKTKQEFETSGYSVAYLYDETFAFTPSCKSMFIKVNRCVYMDHRFLWLNPNSGQWMRWYGCLGSVYNHLLGKERAKQHQHETV